MVRCGFVSWFFLRIFVVQRLWLLKAYLMKRFMKLFSALLFSTALFMSCASNKPKLLSFEYLPVDFQSMYNENGPNSYLINSEMDMQQVLKKLEMQPINEVDYSLFYEKNSLLLIYGGMQRTTGYKVDLKSVSLVKGKLEVLAELHSPGEGCLMGDAITYPAQLIAVQKMASQDVKLTMPLVSKPCR